MIMRYGPSENISPITSNTETNALNNNHEKTKLTPTLQKVVDTVLNILETNPEKTKKITEKFSQLFNKLTQNPETIKALDEKIITNMHTKLHILISEFQNGNISQEEAKNWGREIIQQATTERLYILQLENSTKTT